MSRNSTYKLSQEPRSYQTQGPLRSEPQHEDVVEDVSDRKIKVLKMLLIKRSKDADANQRVVVVEYLRRRLYDVEKLPMIYRCVTLMILMMSSPNIFVVVVEYPSD